MNRIRPTAKFRKHSSGFIPPTTLNLKLDRKSTRLNSSHTVIYTLSLHDALPIYRDTGAIKTNEQDSTYSKIQKTLFRIYTANNLKSEIRSEEHTSELQSHRDLHSFPTRRSSDLQGYGSHKNE